MNKTQTEPDMIKRQTIAAMLTTTAIAFSIATPAKPPACSKRRTVRHRLRHQR